MRLQRYPDGGNAWTLFIWSRHPKWSMTWTHGFSVSWERKGVWNAPRKLALFRTEKRTAGRTFYFRIGRFWGEWMRQLPYPKGDTHE